MPEGVVVPRGARVSADLVARPEGEADAPAEPVPVLGKDPGELQHGDVPGGVVHDAGGKGGCIHVTVYQEEPIGLLFPLDLRDEEREGLPTRLDDGRDSSPDAAPLDELPE